MNGLKLGKPSIGYVIIETATTAEDVEPAKIIRSDTANNRVLAEGVVQEANEQNRNGRWYDSRDLFPQLTCPRTMELLRTGNMRAENGHPLDKDLVRQQTIDPKLVCVRFNKIWVEKNLVKAIYEGTDNAYGEEVDTELRNGVKHAFSLRALGSIENIDGKAYVKNIKVITYDRVIYPSHKRAYTERIVSESAIDGTPIQENQIIVPENDPGKIITLKESDARIVLNRLQRESANLSQIVETFDGLYDNITLLDEHTLLMTNRFGDRITTNLENHVSNIIMDYVWKM